MESFEKEARLKYFYLIDTEKLINNIEENLKTQNLSSPDLIFDTIFSEIKTICNPYIQFISSSDSFDNPEFYNNYLDQIKFLQCEILKNHCIVHGFLTAINKLDSEEKRIKISGANDYNLRQGYFKTDYFQNKLPLKDAKESLNVNIFQEYDQHKKRFNKNINLRSYNILRNCHCGSGDEIIDDTNSNNNFINVHRHNGNWGCFIYTNPTVRTLDQSKGKKPKNFITNYENLLTECIKWCHDNELLFEDKLLFECKMESIYGFSFFIYAAQLLDRIHSSPSDEKIITLKDLEGSLMLELIQKTAQLPIVYNHSFFLEYAIQSVLASRRLRTQNFRSKPNSLFEYVSTASASKEQLIISGFHDISMYLQKLRFVIPLLEDLWDVAINNLNENNLSSYIDIKSYRSYISSNYPMITQNYTSYMEDKKKLSQINEKTFRNTNSAKTDMLYREYKFMLLSSGIRSNLSNLLSDYFDKVKKIPVESANLYEHVLLNPGLPPEKLPPSQTNGANFLKTYTENILSFAETLV